MAAISVRALSLQERWARLSKTYGAHRPLVQRILNLTFVIYVLGTTYHALSAKPSYPSAKQRKGKGVQEGENARPPRVAVSSSMSCPIRPGSLRLKVDALFYKRFAKLIRIVIPGIRSREALLLVTHSGLLIFRTAISLYVAALDGKYVLHSCVSFGYLPSPSHPSLVH